MKNLKIAALGLFLSGGAACALASSRVEGLDQDPQKGETVSREAIDKEAIKMIKSDKINSVQSINLESKNVPQKETMYATVVVDGQKIKCNGFFEKMDRSTIQAMQAHIDKGGVGVSFNRLDHTDEKISYVFGHNPGPMAPLANAVKDGKEITIYDINGVAKKYTLKFVGHQEKKTGPMNPEVKKILLSTKEGVMFQFCAPDRMEYWLALPTA